MANTVEQIKNRLGVVDVVGSYLKLEKAGVNFKSRCPFHNEKTPSFFVSPQRDSFYCFGCGRKGDIFNFVQEFEGVDFVGSLKILADRAGVKIEKVDPKLIDERERLFALLEESTSFFELELDKNKRALNYLKERGLDGKTIKSFRIGFAPDSWDVLLKRLREEGYSEREALDAGMVKKSDDKGGKIYDRFRSRIMFPVADPSGRITAFSGRIFPKEDEHSAKYLNSPETKLFKKSQTLFAYDKAKLDIRKSDFAILVEGQIDVLLAHQAGYRNTVAPLGTALTREQVEKISRITKKLVIAFDSDGAGVKASSRGARIALALGVDLKVATMPEGYDPADLILKNVDKWRDAIRESKHIIEFYLQRLEKDEPDKRKLSLRIKEEVLPFVVMLENKIDQAHFIKILAEKMAVPHEAIANEMQKINLEDLDIPYPKDEEKDKKEDLGRRRVILRKIVGIIFRQETLEDKTTNLENFKKELSRITGKKKILEDFDSEDKEQVIFEADVLYEDPSGLERELDKLLLRLEEDYLKEEFNKEMQYLRQAEKDKDSKKSLEILKKCQNLSKKINSIKSKF